MFDLQNFGEYSGECFPRKLYEKYSLPLGAFVERVAIRYMAKLWNTYKAVVSAIRNFRVTLKNNYNFIKQKVSIINHESF